MLLAQREGWEVEICSDLPEAEDLLHRRAPDLIAIAPKLPSSSFETALQRLRSIPSVQSIPIVLIASPVDEETASSALSVGATEVFQDGNLATFQAYLVTFARLETEDLDGYRILILEDDRAVGQYLKSMIEALGPRVELFNSEVAAFSAASRFHYDLIVTDLVLKHGESGNRFIRLLRKSNGKSATSPIIAISGFADNARRVEAIRSGANTYIVKPVVEAELRSYILRLLQRDPPPTRSFGTESFPKDISIYGLSNKEQLICSLVEAGYSDKGIARHLGISYWTVRTHLGRIFRKCKVANRVKLVNILHCNVGATGLIPSSQQPAADPRLDLDSHVIDGLRYGLIVTDRNHLILQVNPAFAVLTGYSASEAVGKTPSILQSSHQRREFYQALHAELDEAGCWSGEIWNRHKNGQIYLAWLDIRRLPPGTPRNAHYVGIICDIADRHREIENILQSALHDALTGLPNRALLKDRVLHEIARAGRTQSAFACIFIDLDRFKPINDEHGHEVGDRVLQEVADRLRSVFRTADTIARYGGDEFVALVPDIVDQCIALAIGQKILRIFSAPITFADTQYSLNASIGISLYPRDGDSYRELIDKADRSMYRAKRAGGGQIRFHEMTIHEEMRQ